MAIEREGGGAAPESPTENPSDAGDSAVRHANEQFEQSVADHLKLPIVVLTEQRDAALRQAYAVLEEARARQGTMVAEQDSFITFLVEDHQRQIQALEAKLASAREDAQRLRVARTPSPNAPEEVQRAIAELQQQLETAYAEMDETRADAVRLQTERDDAICKVDDVRVELSARIETVLDEAFALQTQLDEANRLLEDSRDEAREEALRLSEELEDARRELDERRAEVVRVRNRLQAATDGMRLSEPPPPAVSEELESARQEAASLRRHLIVTKRELSRVKRELDQAQTQPKRVRTWPGVPRPKTTPDAD